jgi:KaiC/GvpD/RAD55 family RecA-like ATPase
MAKIALATLESALRERKLDRTLTTALSPLDRTDPAAFVPTGLGALDAHLRSGVPRGQLSEIVGPRSSGRTTLLLQLLASATREGELVALVDTFDRLDVASLVAAGADLSRVLWVRGQAVAKTESAVDSRWVPGEGTGERSVRSSAVEGLVERTIDRALKSFNLVLQAGGFGIVALDLADAPRMALQRMPFTTWMRVQRAIEGRDTACVLVAAEPVARSAGGVTLALTGRTTWTGHTDRSRQVAGGDVHVRVVSPRRRVDGDLRVGAVIREDTRENTVREAC